MAAPTVPSVRVVKNLGYKGGIRLWSNRYCITAGAPSDDTHWHTLFDNIVAAEKLALTPNVNIKECLGYLAGSDVAVSSKVYSQQGLSGHESGELGQAGDVCALVRWSTAARSTKNHPIYLFKYYHGIWVRTGVSDYDTLDLTNKAALETYASAWVVGFSDGTVTHKLTSPSGHAATGSLVEEFVTHRDFPYSTSV